MSFRVTSEAAQLSLLLQYSVTRISRVLFQCSAVDMSAYYIYKRCCGVLVEPIQGDRFLLTILKEGAENVFVWHAGKRRT